MNIDMLAERLTRFINAGDQHSWIMHWNPDTGEAEDQDSYAPIPGTEMRLQVERGERIDTTMLAIHLYRGLLKAGAEGGSGYRDHVEGKGYRLNVPDYLRIQVYKWNTYVYVCIARHAVGTYGGSDAAAVMNSDGYYDATQRRWIKRSAYGDYRRDREPVGRSLDLPGGHVIQE